MTQEVRYIAILGRQPELGLLELESQLGADAVLPIGAAAVINQAINLDRFGGIEKLGRLVAVYKGVGSLEQLDDDPSFFELFEGSIARGSKVTFGVSCYGRKIDARDRLNFGHQLKTKLDREAGLKSRFIITAPGRQDISAAQLKFNRVMTKGFELLLIWHNDSLYVGLTTQYQNIDQYGARDHGRPARSAVVGMLPPKLAQIMVNTTTSPQIYDPFCGTGVVLQEAALLERLVAGSDISTEMVASSRTNLAWLISQEQLWSSPGVEALKACKASLNLETDIKLADARTVALPHGLTAVVSEGYLGPNLTTTPSPERLTGIQQELMALYCDALTNFCRQLPQEGQVTIAVPAWRQKTGWIHLPLVDELTRLGYNNKVFRHLDQPVLYARPDQTVGRQLIVLTKR